MSENLPACKYWQEAGMTGGAALNRKETVGQKESCYLPTGRLPASPSLKAEFWQRRGQGKSPLPRNVGNKSVVFQEQISDWFSRTGAHKNQVFQNQLPRGGRRVRAWTFAPPLCCCSHENSWWKKPWRYFSLVLVSSRLLLVLSKAHLSRSSFICSGRV